MNNDEGAGIKLALPKAFPYIAVAFVLIVILVSLRPSTVETKFAVGTITKCNRPTAIKAGTSIGGYLAGLKLESGEETVIWLEYCREGEVVRVKTTGGFWPFGQRYEATAT